MLLPCRAEWCPVVFYGPDGASGALWCPVVSFGVLYGVEVNSYDRESRCE